MELTPELILQAYANGVFPMAESRDDDSLFWVDPRDRGILPLDGFHISRSLARLIRQDRYRVTLNRDFIGVMEGCADREETWINATIFDLYCELHDMGFGHSVELWDEDRLVGGTYGLALGTAFFGESMFSRVPSASKIVLAYLVARLRLTGFTLFDTQFLTEHLASLGGIEISRAEYRVRLRKALETRADLTALPAPLTPELVLSECRR
ncbi:leucyl/phenylalanyl-tRNA--protein transferase [Celeribacter ethanolicus]|uniref:Leucyl/phenylalanyl-tRNA--protein transferase n=1 Tax=Celeribacter ethanolicus TaxID=1758178 RepID=A0A291GHF9_9RHOB|nr:leucyl/phenylalanyl-tRNA--protein transferase [Celeribacter ethanolicus]ATG49635.1 leucyl/phenylalanyl-tRNA--protein transferase [Celeribacter ethanolicus]TNE68843.1 MAG: leucyl/phenylalanyl-tRNA--protein transferase [Paracoccaceae bacterium]